MSGGKLERTVMICNAKGLHARASAKFVQTACRFSAKITVSKDGQTVTGTSIMGLMMLAAGRGTELELTAEGDDAAAAMIAICELIADKFGEGE